MKYFAGNTLASFFRTSTAVVESTSGGKFNSTYVPNSILLGNVLADQLQARQPFNGNTSITGTFYLRYDFQDSFMSLAQAHLTMLNAAANAYRINFSGGTTYQVQYWNSGTSAWVNWGSTFTLPLTTLHTIVLKLTPNVGYTVYLAGTSIASSAVVPTNGASAVDQFNWSGVSTNTFVSQIMCADYDLRDSHLMLAALNGNSATNTAGTGAYTDVNETVLDEATAVVLAAAGKKGQTHAAITVPVGLGIAALVVNARGRATGGAVTDGKLGVRSNSINTSSSALVYNGGYEPRGAIWEGDPGNSNAAWTQTPFNNAEIYEEAI